MQILFADVLKRNPAITVHLNSETIDSLPDLGEYTGLEDVFVDQVTAE